MNERRRKEKKDFKKIQQKDIIDIQTDGQKERKKEDVYTQLKI